MRQPLRALPETGGLSAFLVPEEFCQGLLIW
jgi:hypothetical protein